MIFPKKILKKLNNVQLFRFQYFYMLFKFLRVF